MSSVWERQAPSLISIRSATCGITVFVSTVSVSSAAARVISFWVEPARTDLSPPSWRTVRRRAPCAAPDRTGVLRPWPVSPRSRAGSPRPSRTSRGPVDSVSAGLAGGKLQRSVERGRQVVHQRPGLVPWDIAGCWCRCGSGTFVGNDRALR